jgi:hypothetical protein
LVIGVEMYPKATNPDSIVRKLHECRFFLVQMAEHELTLDSEKFQYCLSAFLCSFRTCAYRCYGVTEHKRGKPASRDLRLQLRNHPEIGFLLSRTNVEIHEDGVVVQQLYRTYGDAVIVRHALGWRFEGNPKNLIELCHDALEAMQKFAVPVLGSDPR